MLSPKLRPRAPGLPTRRCHALRPSRPGAPHARAPTAAPSTPFTPRGQSGAYAAGPASRRRGDLALRLRGTEVVVSWTFPLEVVVSRKLRGRRGRGAPRGVQAGGLAKAPCGPQRRKDGRFSLSSRTATSGVNGCDLVHLRGCGVDRRESLEAHPEGGPPTGGPPTPRNGIFNLGCKKNLARTWVSLNPPSRNKCVIPDGVRRRPHRHGKPGSDSRRGREDARHRNQVRTDGVAQRMPGALPSCSTLYTSPLQGWPPHTCKVYWPA